MISLSSFDDDDDVSDDNDSSDDDDDGIDNDDADADNDDKLSIISSLTPKIFRTIVGLLFFHN